MSLHQALFSLSSYKGMFSQPSHQVLVSLSSCQVLLSLPSHQALISLPSTPSPDFNVLSFPSYHFLYFRHTKPCCLHCLHTKSCFHCPHSKSCFRHVLLIYLFCLFYFYVLFFQNQYVQNVFLHTWRQSTGVRELSPVH